jgi:hypothetical protein
MRGRRRTVFVLSGGVLSTEVIPDTEEVTGSIPVSPTSTKRPLTSGNAGQGSFILESFKRPMVPLIDKVRDK